MGKQTIQVEHDVQPILNSPLSHMRFRKSAHLKITQQTQRGEIAVIVLNTLSNKQFCTTPFVERIIQSFSTTTTLGQVITDNSFSQSIKTDEWIEILTQLINADILESPELNNDALKFEIQKKSRQQLRQRSLSKPWMIKVPLINPNCILSALNRHTQKFWQFKILVVWAFFVCAAAIGAISEFEHLQDFWLSRFLSPRNLALAFACYLFLKIVHELGHGLAAKHWGGEVVDAGVMFIFFVPMPYIDVSHSATFTSKVAKLTVSAAGMIFELFIAAAAFFVWQYTDSIILKEICINLLIIGAVTSVLFNANPLLKFDGYYILSDLLEIHNLSQRSVEALKSSVLDKLFNISLPSPARSKKEHSILAIYGMLSLMYRLCISFLIAFYIAAQYFSFGIFLAVWLLFSQVFSPLVSLTKSIRQLARDQGQNTRLIRRTAAGIFLPTAIIFLIPLSHKTLVEGIVVPSSEAYINTKASGFVTSINIHNNANVNKGDILFSLQNKTLDSELLQVANEIEEYKTLSYRYSTEDPSQADYYRNQVHALELKQIDLQEQSASLQIKAPMNGLFLGNKIDDLQGRYLKKGDFIGVISNNNNVKIIALVNDRLVKKIDDYKAVELTFPSKSHKTFVPKSVNKTPAAISELPNKFLSLPHGGNIEIDAQRDNHLTPLLPTYQVTLSNLDIDAPPIIGTRATIKFVNDRQTLAAQMTNFIVGLLDELGILQKF